MSDLKKRVEQLNNKIAIDPGRQGFDEAAAIIYETGISGIMLQTHIDNNVVIRFIGDQKELIKELVEREAKLVEALKWYAENIGGDSWESEAYHDNGDRAKGEV